MPNLTEQTCQHLRDLIRRKGASINALPPERQLAEELRISRVTVRRALAQLAEEGLLERHHGSGTYVRGSSIPLAAARRTGRLCLFFPKMVDEFPTGSLYGEILLGMTGEVVRANCSLIFQTADRLGKADAFWEGCRSREFEGVFLVAVTNQETHALVRQMGIPAMLVDHGDVLSGLDGILDDSDAGAKAAAGYLLELGHRAIGYIGWTRDEEDGPHRETAFLQELKRHGVEVPDAWIWRGMTGPESGYQGLLRLMAAPRRPTAVFCYNNLMVYGAYKAACELGLSIPRHVSLLGYGDESIRSTFHARWDSKDFVGEGPAVTRFAFDQREIGRAAVRRLLWRIEHPVAPAKLIRLPVRLVEGGSCQAR